MTETVQTAIELAQIYYNAGIPCYTEGPPGVGKSDMWRQIAARNKIGFIDLRLAQLDPVSDFRGLPKHKGEGTTWARPDFWPTVETHGEKGIILFDELGDCGKAMQSAAYQIVLDGRAGPHLLPPGWYRAAAGNSQKHKAGAQAMSTALANRFAWIEIKADPEAWILWANKNDISPLITAFIRFRPALLHTMEGANTKAFASPRSWAKASLVADCPEHLRFKAIRGCVGDGAASEFEGFMRTLEMPDLDDIVSNPKGTMIPAKPACKYAVSSMLARYMTRANMASIMIYAKRPEFGRDFEIAMVLDASKRDSSLTETKAYVDWANRNQDITL